MARRSKKFNGDGSTLVTHWCQGCPGKNISHTIATLFVVMLMRVILLIARMNARAWVNIVKIQPAPIIHYWPKLLNFSHCHHSPGDMNLWSHGGGSGLTCGWSGGICEIFNSITSRKVGKWGRGNDPYSPPPSQGLCDSADCGRPRQVVGGVGWIGRYGGVLRHLWAHYLCTIALPVAPSLAAHWVDVDADSVGLASDNATAYWWLHLRKSGTAPPGRDGHKEGKGGSSAVAPLVAAVHALHRDQWSQTTHANQTLECIIEQLAIRRFSWRSLFASHQTTFSSANNPKNIVQYPVAKRNVNRGSH